MKPKVMLALVTSHAELGSGEGNDSCRVEEAQRGWGGRVVDSPAGWYVNTKYRHRG